MKRKLLCLIILFLITVVTFGCDSEEENIASQEILDNDWDQIENISEGTEVNFYMWGGDERINDWVDNYAATQLKEKYDVNLNRVPMGPGDYLNQLLNEKQVGKETGSIDLVWINGENFHIARDNDLLFGPFAEDLPNYQQYVDGECPEITNDFGYPTDGYESPWGKAQFTFTYDQVRTDEAPYTFEEFVSWIRENPGKFTYPDPTTDFTGSVFVRHIIYEKTGGYEQYQDIDDKDKFREKILPALEFLNELKPYLWREGETYPANNAQLNNMFADGELVGTMAYSSILTSGEIAAGNFPETARTFVLENGTISDTHYVAIPYNAPNKAGGLILANFLLSFEAQLEKFKPEVWGDLPVFSYEKLSQDEKTKVDNIDIGKASLEQKVLDEHSIPEMPADLVPVVEEEWDNIVNQ